MITEAEQNEPKPAFNKRYGEWLREMRLELGMSQENVAAAAGVDIAALCAAEDGHVIEIYDAVRLCKFFHVDE